MIGSASLCSDVWTDGLIGAAILLIGGCINSAAAAPFLEPQAPMPAGLVRRDRLLLWFPFGYVLFLFQAFVAEAMSLPLALPFLTALAGLIAVRHGRDWPRPSLWWCALLIPAFGFSFDVLPLCHNGAGHLGLVMFDHTKSAVIDTLVREGFPMRNPFANYPGHPSLFFYYGLMYVAGAAIAGPFGLSGWGMDAALNVVTTFSALCLMAALALALSGGRRLAAPLAAVVAAFPRIGELFEGWLVDPGFFGYTLTAPIPLLSEHFSWVPQHVLTAVAGLTVFLVYGPVLRAKTSPRWATTGYAAIALAVAGSSSVYVTLVLVAAAAVWALPKLRQSAPLLAPHLLAFAAVGLPVAYLFYGLPASAGPKAFPLALKLHIPVYGMAITSWSDGIQAFVLYWVYKVPIHLGLVLLVAALGLRRLRQGPAEDWRGPTLILVTLGLLIFQSVASVIAQNDFGWRAVLPAEMLLAAWGAAWLSCGVSDGRTGRDRLLGVLLMVAVALQAITHDAVFVKTIKPLSAVDEDEFAVFRQSADCWRALARETPATALVQDNPRGLPHTAIIPVGIGLPLLANRKALFSSSKFADSYGLNLPAELRATLAERLAIIFDSPSVSPADLVWMHDEAGVQGAVLLRTDAAWDSPAWTAGKVYREVYRNAGCAAYLAP